MGSSCDVEPIRVGWQGIEVEVPGGWELHAYGGAFESGHFELDDGVQSCFRLRWHRGRKRGADPHKALEQYRRSLNKRRRRDSQFEVLTPEFLPSRCRRDRDITVFRRQDAVTTYGIAWHCQTCGCVGMAEVCGDEAANRVAKRILASISDHRDDAQRLWAVYDFAFLAPDTYNLARAELTPGRLSFPLRRSQQDLLHVERWGVAREWLKRAALENWPRELAKRLKRVELALVSQERFDFRSHEAWRFCQPGSTRWRWRHSPPLDGVVWHCPEDDKVFAVFGQGTEEHVVRQVALTISCG